MRKIDKHNECQFCANRRAVPGTCHIRCAKPDPQMTGNSHGIKHGWFMYPFLFDPVWKESQCANFEKASKCYTAS